MRNVLNLTASIAIGLLAATRPLSADEIAVFNELLSEYTDCFAYYSLAKQCAPENATKADLARMQGFVDTSATGIIAAGKSAGMSEAAILARSKLALTSVAQSIDGKCVNFSIVIEKFGNLCKDLMANPKAREDDLRARLGK